MKKLFIAFAAIATLASCNNDQIIDFDKNPINFGEAFVENSVRATDNTYGAQPLTTFNVYGTVTGTAGTVNIFNGVLVSGTVGQNEWSYEEQYAQYWIPLADYKFAAVVDANTVTPGDFDMPAALVYNTDGQKDLLYAEAAVNDASAEQGAVNFTFSHLLSKVHFTITSNAQGGYYHSITGIQIANFETGTYTIAHNAQGEWVPANSTWVGTTPTNISFGSVNEVTASGAKTNDTQMLLVPNAATYNVIFTVDLYKGTTKLGTETKTIPVSNDLVAGHAYNFTIECSVGNPIKFKVENDPTWGDTTDVKIQ